MGEGDTPTATAMATRPRLCLDFANTAEWHAREQPVEKLHTYADLVSWSRDAGLVTAAQAKRLLTEGSRRPADAEAVLDRARSLREAIYRIFSAVAAGRAPEGADLEALNTALAEGLGRSRVVARGRGYAWGWSTGDDELDRMLWPVARSAADLLTSDELATVRECAGDPCGWLFLDMSRNHSRRWCDMKDCGNRAKARRHYQRTRAAGSSGR